MTCYYQTKVFEYFHLRAKLFTKFTLVKRFTVSIKCRFKISFVNCFTMFSDYFVKVRQVAVQEFINSLIRLCCRSGVFIVNFNIFHTLF